MISETYQKYKTVSGNRDSDDTLSEHLVFSEREHKYKSIEQLKRFIEELIELHQNHNYKSKKIKNTNPLLLAKQIWIWINKEYSYYWIHVVKLNLTKSKQ